MDEVFLVVGQEEHLEVEVFFLVGLVETGLDVSLLLLDDLPSLLLDELVVLGLQFLI